MTLQSACETDPGRCITNVTPKIAAIIMATATSNEHKAVQDLLPMHIYGTPHIGVKIPVGDPKAS